MAETFVAIVIAAGLAFIVKSFLGSRAEADAAKRRLDADLAARQLQDRHDSLDRRFGLREEVNTAEAAPTPADYLVAPPTEAPESAS